MRRRPRPRRALAALLFVPAALGLAGCGLFQPGERATIKYVGSSTVANFVRDAEPVYGRVEFEIDDRPESAGGERAILDGTTELAGVARTPRPEVLRTGIASAQVGRDAIAVIVNQANPVANLTAAQLRDVFTGKAKNWTELGWPRDLAIQPFIAGSESATHQVFREQVLAEAEYSGCEVVRPDKDIIERVKRNPGAIGHISFSFLIGVKDIKPVAVDGEDPDVTNFNYPIYRSLHLLYREGGKPEVEDFAQWAQTKVGQQVVMRRFVGIRVLIPAIEPEPPQEAKLGTLMVYTETFAHYDGGIWYCPHRSYDLLTRYGEKIRRVRNHRGLNDERPAKVLLAPDIYLVRPETCDLRGPEYLVKIEAGKVTVLDVPEKQKARGK